MLIRNCRIIYENQIENGSVLIADGKIQELNTTITEDDTVIEANGMYLSPGFIDIHIHGAGGYDTMDGTYEALNSISKTIATNGTTAFLPTTMTCKIEEIRKALASISNAKHRGTEGAIVLGAHMEGPFINPAMIGAQNPNFLQKPSLECFHEIAKDYLSDVTSVTLAPELEGASDLIRYLVEQKIKVSVGHSSATYEATMNAIRLGLSHSTHLFNAMKGLHHRDPGVLGAVFDSDITAEVIVDGIHVAYPALRVALKQKGVEKMILVTDAMMACCMPDGLYYLGGQEVYVAEKRANLKSGTLAGSILTLNKAVKNVYENTLLSLPEVIKLATYNPAKYCNVENRKGLIKEGYDGDLILFDDDIEIQYTIVGGKLVYSK